MGAVRQMWVDSLTTDREMGAKRCPNLEHGLKGPRVSYDAAQRIARGRRVPKHHHPAAVYKARERAYKTLPTVHRVQMRWPLKRAG